LFCFLSTTVNLNTTEDEHNQQQTHTTKQNKTK